MTGPMRQQTSPGYLWLAAAIAYLLLVGTAYAWNGLDEVRRAVAAMAVSIPGAYVSLKIADRSKHWDPRAWTVVLASGNTIRILLSIPLAFLVGCVILSERTASFWVWFLVGYALTLVADVIGILRLIKKQASAANLGGRSPS